jgi:hypothetical protein
MAGAGFAIVKGLTMFNEESYLETIERISKRDGLDLIVSNLKIAGYAPVIDQTGGFCLCVGVYGERGFIWSNDELVCIYSHEEGDEGKMLISRGCEESALDWALRCVESFEDNEHHIGRLFGDIESDLLGVLSAEDLEILDFIRLEESRRIGADISRVQFCENSVTGFGWSLDPVEFSAGLRASFESAGFANA